MKLNNQVHGYHLVDPSPWPIISAFSALALTLGSVLYFHGYVEDELWIFGLFSLVLSAAFWWRDVVREATMEGQHTLIVQSGLRIGMILFIASEVMFFFAFFWAFFHFSINPSYSIGSIWPPSGLVILSAWLVPLLNSFLLLTSAATVTVAHNFLLSGDKEEASRALISTIVLACIFTLFQVFEYRGASFTISDGAYGSTFYMATGFHGFHVFIGTCFLTVCYIRLLNDHFTREHHFGFEAAAWYWHFVDVVWLFLFLSIYWWGA